MIIKGEAMNKKIRSAVAVILVLCMCIGLAACGGGNKPTPAQNNTAQTNTNTAPSNNANNANNTAPANDANNANSTNTAPEETIRLADDNDETAKKCIEEVSRLYPKTETVLDQDISVAYLYGWEAYCVDKDNYLVNYAFDYENKTKDDGYAAVSFECSVGSDGKTEVTPVGSSVLDSKYKELGIEAYATPWDIDVNIGYYEDTLEMVEDPAEVLFGLTFFFRNLGVQPYLYTTDEAAADLDKAAQDKYDELFTKADGKTDGYHVLIYINKGADGNFKIVSKGGTDARRLLGNGVGAAVETKFIENWLKSEVFSDVVMNACEDCVYELYTCQYDSYYTGKTAEIPAKLTYADISEQGIQEEYYPTIEFINDSEFIYVINTYEGMYEASGEYYALMDTNGNTVVECTLIDEPDKDGYVTQYDNLVFDLIDLGGYGIWFYQGDDTGVCWDRECAFTEDYGTDYITVTLK